MDIWSRIKAPQTVIKVKDFEVMPLVTLMSLQLSHHIPPDSKRRHTSTARPALA